MSPTASALLLSLLLLLTDLSVAALVPSDIVARLHWANGSTVDASPLVRLALGGAPPGQEFSASYALDRKGTFLYHPKSTDGGDTACQGAVNVEQIGLLATPDIAPVIRNWLLLAVLRQAALSNSGQVWSQPGGPYHGFGQGAIEANAEFIMMARTYAAQTGDTALFAVAPERLLCADGRYVGAGSWNDTVCSQEPGVLLRSHPQLFGDTASVPHCSVPRGESKPGLYPGQGKVVVTRVRLPTATTQLSLALSGGGHGALNASVCVRSVTADAVVATVRLPAGGVPQGWVTLDAALAPGEYDVALQASAGEVAWLSDSRPAVSGGARTEVYDEGEPPRGCCSKHAGNSTLSAKLEQALAWQLQHSRKSNGSFGMFVTGDGRFNGTPKRESGITSSSAMWDQIRMGWKAAYPALRVLGSLVVWLELATTGFVSAAGVSEEVIDGVRKDIFTQLGQSVDGTLLTWRSCELQGGPPTPPSNLPSSSCDRDDPAAPHQRSFDLGFVPDHALAVKLGVIKPEVLHAMLPAIRHKSGHRLATKRFEDQWRGGLIMVDSEKWSCVDDQGFAEPKEGCKGWSQVFAPPRTDGPGNFDNHEQNGGRLFSVSKFVLEAVMYAEAADDWAEQVTGATAIAESLLRPQSNATAPLPFPGLVRTPMPPGSLAQAYCVVAYGPGGKAVDRYGKNACDYYGDMTWGLRDGQLGPTLELLKGLLGFRALANGTMALHGAVSFSSEELGGCAPCKVTAQLPSEIAETWPRGLGKVELGGINVGTYPNCSIYATVQETADAISVAYTITAGGTFGGGGGGVGSDH